ncbi:MAG: ribonuclease HIII [Akkermansia sp.]|nr:ribonuclease HIII [Akkermansia sp.]
MANQFSIQLSHDEATALNKKLAAAPEFRATTREYADFCYESDSVNVAFYPRKGKLLIQGRGAEDFLKNTLQLQPGEKAPALGTTLPALVDTTPHFGVDESGKGDYFGPLVVAGVYTDERCAVELVRLGCRDSKAIPDDKKIQSLAERIKKTAGVVYEVICIGPRRYNELYEEIGNLNRLLAWGHARVIAALHEKVPSCPRALSDQFANEWVLKRALGQRRIPVQLEQRTKAESDVAVAAASILARARFVQWMQQTATASNCPMPLGCAPHVTRAAQHFIDTHGRERLQDVAKLHFKVTQKLK